MVSTAGAVILVGCGAPAAQAPAQQRVEPLIDVTMTDYRFAPNPIKVTAGHVRFRVSNAGSVGHDFTLLTPDGRRRLAHTTLVSPGDTVVVSLNLPAGTYPVICTQPGHQELGMEAKIIATNEG